MSVVDPLIGMSGKRLAHSTSITALCCVKGQPGPTLLLRRSSDRLGVVEGCMLRVAGGHPPQSPPDCLRRRFIIDRGPSTVDVAVRSQSARSSHEANHAQLQQTAFPQVRALFQHSPTTVNHA